MKQLKQKTVAGIEHVAHRVRHVSQEVTMILLADAIRNLDLIEKGFLWIMRLKFIIPIAGCSGLVIWFIVPVILELFSEKEI